MTTGLAAPPTVFDPRAVGSLTGHPDDGAFALVFVGRYRDLLPQRIRRVVAALGGEDRAVTLDAVLSLKTSSATVGARELHALADRIEAHVRRAETALAHEVAALLHGAAHRAERALSAYLG